MGAMDVCPFIPVQNTTMEDCVEVAKEFAERLSVELGVPGMYRYVAWKMGETSKLCEVDCIIYGVTDSHLNSKSS